MVCLCKTKHKKNYSKIPIVVTYARKHNISRRQKASYEWKPLSTSYHQIYKYRRVRCSLLFRETVKDDFRRI